MPRGVYFRTETWKISQRMGKIGRHFSPSTEFKKGVHVPRGEDNPNWRGGVAPLESMIRGLEENKQWKISVYKKDNFTCIMCGKSDSGRLIAHHIKKFSKIVKEFLELYNQFSPIEDKEILVRLATKYYPFCDVKNGNTFCEECHKETHFSRG